MVLLFGYEYVWWLIPIMIWEITWKAIAMWKSARNNQIGWFIVVLIINSFGILPILYLLFFQNRRVRSMVKNSKKKKK